MSDIKGYRELTCHEKDVINTLKEEERRILSAIERIREAAPMHNNDARWFSIGVTHIEQGFMALVRSVARPEI
jgi:hypothetical protein